MGLRWAVEVGEGVKEQDGIRELTALPTVVVENGERGAQSQEAIEVTMLLLWSEAQLLINYAQRTRGKIISG